MPTPQSAKPNTIVLPHLEREVPLLHGSDGRPMVPMHALCRMLGLDATCEIRRAQRVLLWVAASLLPMVMSRGGEVRYAWCLPYPLHVGYWFGQVYGQVSDPALREALLRTIKDTDHLGGRVFWHLHERFVVGRQRMRQLPLAIQSIGDLLERLQGNPRVRVSKTKRDGLAILALRHQALREQAEAFVRGWFAAAQRTVLIAHRTTTIARVK